MARRGSTVQVRQRACERARKRVPFFSCLRQHRRHLLLVGLWLNTKPAEPARIARRAMWATHRSNLGNAADVLMRLVAYRRLRRQCGRKERRDRDETVELCPCGDGDAGGGGGDLLDAVYDCG